MVKEILEELTVDVSPELGGWASMAAADTQPHVEEMEAVAAAAEAQSPEVTDEKEKYLELYEAKVSSLEEEAASMRSLLGEARAQLNFLILENAKLLYQNKALNSASLNERQKEKIVDAVRNATTVEEAKMLFETLQSAVGGHKTRRTNSLREAVSRPSASMLLSSKREAASTAVDPNLDRMLRLAGLRKQ
jgi:monoamine oxidase